MIKWTQEKVDKTEGMLEKFFPMLNEKIVKIVSIEGPIKKISEYGGGVFIRFETGRCYKLSLGLYDMPTCVLDDINLPV